MALAALRGDKTVIAISQQHEVHPNQVTKWERQLPERAAEVSDGGAAGRKEDGPLHAKIGQQALESFFKRRAAQQGGIAERKEMIDRTHDLPVARHLEKRNGKRGTIDPETVSQRGQIESDPR